HLVTHETFGGLEKNATANRVRFEDALSPRPQREAVETAFAFADCATGQAAELFTQLCLCRGERIGQPPAKSLRAVQALAIENYKQRAFQPDDARQTLRAAPTREQAQLDLRQTELGAGLIENQSIIAGEGELQPAAQACPTDGRDCRHGQSSKLIEQFLPGR